MALASRLQLGVRRHGRPCRVVIVAACCLAAGRCAHTFIDSPVDHNLARYISGTTKAGLSAASSRLSGLKVSGRIPARSETQFIFDAGRDGVLTIPYAAITDLIYGPQFAPGLSGQGPRWSTRPQPRKYPWGTWSHRYRTHFLKILFRDSAGQYQDVVFSLGDGIVRPTLNTLERRTDLPLVFEVPEACIQYRTEAECGYGPASAMKGLTKVYVDTSESREWTPGEAQQRIVSTLTQAGLGLEVVSEAGDAAVILAFRYDAGTRPQWLHGVNDVPDRAVGEVYVVTAAGLRAVMVFDEELNLYRTRLAVRFAEAFVRAYKEANGLTQAITSGGATAHATVRR